MGLSLDRVSAQFEAHYNDDFRTVSHSNPILRLCAYNGAHHARLQGCTSQDQKGQQAH